LGYPSPDLCVDTILSLTSTDNSFNFMAWFLLWRVLSTVGPYIDSCEPFWIMSNQLNVPQVDSSQVVETSQGWSVEMMHPSSMSRLIEKGLYTYVNNVFLFVIFNTFANISKNLFSLCQYGALCLDWWGTCFISSIWEQSCNVTKKIKKGKGSEYFPDALYLPIWPEGSGVNENHTAQCPKITHMHTHKHTHKHTHAN
jgi:hypothetical protein